MTAFVLLLATGLMATLGFALIAVSQTQHWALVRPKRALRRPWALRAAGALALGVAAVLAVNRDGLAFGLLVWATLLTFAALAVAVILSKQPRARAEGPELAIDADPSAQQR